MSIHNYDETIDYIENNITLEKEVLSNAAEAILNIGGRKAGEFFSYIEPENRTLKKYIRDRKLYCALEEFISGYTAEEIVEKYGISTSSRFSSDVNLLVGKYPKTLRKENYSIPKVQHLCDILGLNDNAAQKRTDMTKEERKKYISEIQRLIDENYGLREALTEMKIREIENKQKDIIPIEKNEYQQFLMVEECRQIYGFDVDQILRLYKESLLSKRDLKTLCEEALYDFRFEYEQERELEYERLNGIEALRYQNIYELDSKEAWDYYRGDDSLDELDDDPYSNEEEYEYMEEPDDINPEDYLEYQLIVESQEEDRLEKQLDEIERLIESGELFKDSKFEKEQKGDSGTESEGEDTEDKAF